MKNIKFITLIATTLFFSGCEFLDEMYNFKDKKDKINSAYNAIKFQDEKAPKQIIVTSNCKYNEPVAYTYYETPEDAYSNYFSDTKNLISSPWSGKALKPFWDFRYVNGVSKYVNISSSGLEYADLSLSSGIDARSGDKNIIVGSSLAQLSSEGSAVQAKCVDNTLVAGATINLNDAPEQYIEYAGPQATFIYRLADKKVTYPWSSNGGNLMLQATFNRPIYKNYAKNMGASVSFGIIIRNKKNGQFLNYIIGVYSAGDAWSKEQPNLKYDPTTKIVHVPTVANKMSRWATLSPKSNSNVTLHSDINAISSEGNWNNVYRVNISYNNLKAVLQQLRNNPPPEANGQEFGVNPKDWQVQSVMIQYEIEEEGGKALLSGSFKGFEVYTSKLPL